VNTQHFFREGEALLQELESIYDAHMKLEEGLPLVLSLWTLHTHMYKYFRITPYLWINSPVRGCGKTTLCTLLHSLSANAHYTVGISKAALYRIIETLAPTLVLDEAEGTLNDRDMLALVNAGYSRATGTVVRAYRDGLRSYQVFCPKIISSIKPVPHTIVDRSIKIELQRLLETDMVAPLHEDDESLGQDLLPKMHGWVEQYRGISRALTVHPISVPAPSTPGKRTFGVPCSRSHMCCARAAWRNCKRQRCD